MMLFATRDASTHTQQPSPPAFPEFDAGGGGSVSKKRLGVVVTNAVVDVMAVLELLKTTLKIKMILAIKIFITTTIGTARRLFYYV